MAEAPRWRVRPAGRDDADALALVGAATFLETFGPEIDGPSLVTHCRNRHSAAAYQAYFDIGAQVWLGEAAPGGAPVGYAVIGAPDLPGAEDGDIELKRIYSLSRYHGSGLGVALLDAAIRAGAGHRRMLLGVYHDNPRALAFYRRHGFVDIGERQFDVGGVLYHDLVLARDLAG